MAPTDFSRSVNQAGADYAHQMIMAPPDFQTFLRPCSEVGVPSGTMDLCIEIRVRDRLDLCVIVLLKRKLTHSRRINSTLIVCAGSRDWR